MQEKQLLKEMKKDVVITMNGTTLEDAVGKIFQGMRKELFREFGKPIIQMEAEEVYFEKVDVNKTTERFMIFFWPREKVSYTITAKIVVRMKYLDITKEELSC